MQRHRKDMRTAPADEQRAVIAGAFTDLNRHLPEGLVQDLVTAFAPGTENSPDDDPSSGAPLFDRCQTLADVLDVLHRQYDSENDPLTADDWRTISDAVSGHAADLDMDFVSYVMTLAVDHRAV